MELTEDQAWDVEHTVTGAAATLRHAVKFIGEHPTTGGFYACGPCLLLELAEVAARLEAAAEVLHGNS